MSTMSMDLPLVSIIVPVYNAASHFYKCLNSLRTQSYSSLEVIFINDCSTDESGLILDNFKHEMWEKPNAMSVKVIHHEVNKGVAAARNSGLGIATGDYVYYLDADDYLRDDAIELLVNEAIFSEVDVVGCNWVLQFKGNGRIMKQPNVDNPQQAIEFMAKGIMRWNLWLFLVKRKLYIENHVQFLSGRNMGEDMMVTFRLLLYAESISMIDTPIYFYAQVNGDSLTKTYSKVHKNEVVENLTELNKCFLQAGKVANWDNLFNYLKLNVKLPLLISDETRQYKEWRTWFPESNPYSLKNNLISKRIKLLQFMVSNGQYWFARLHYYLVIKLIYGVIYK